jgi:hypothetical protein
MQLEGLKLEPGIKIEAPPPPPTPYYARTFGSNLSAPNNMDSSIYGTSALAYDSSDNLYVTGGGTNNTTGSQGVTVKFNSDKTVAWQKSLSTSSGSDYNIFYSIDTDSSNNVYISGVIAKNWLSSTKYCTFQIAKYNSSGSLQWQKDLGYGFTKFVPRFGTGLVVEKSTSNFYVTGDVVIGPTTGSQPTSMTLVKYNTSGSIIWARDIETIGTNDNSNAVALDSTGSVYIAGSTVTGGNNTAVLVKHNSAGVLQWQKGLANNVGTNSNQFNDIAIDSSNNIFVCGNTYVFSSLNVGMIAKYNTSGTLLWQKQLYDATGSVFYQSITTDSSGNVYVTGLLNIYNGLIAKYDTNGVLQWQRVFSGSSTAGIVGLYGLSIVLDSSGIMTIGGQANQQTGNNYNMFIFKMPSDGTLTGTYVVNGITINYNTINYTDAVLNLTPITTTMNSANVTYINAGSSSLVDANSTFVDTITPIP